MGKNPSYTQSFVLGVCGCIKKIGRARRALFKHFISNTYTVSSIKQCVSFIFGAHKFEAISFKNGMNNLTAQAKIRSIEPRKNTRTFQYTDGLIGILIMVSLL